VDLILLAIGSALILGAMGMALWSKRGGLPLFLIATAFFVGAVVYTLVTVH